VRRRRNGLTRLHACWQDLRSASPELLAEAGRRLRRKAALLDAEIVCLNAEGRPDFGAVRARMHASQARDGAQQRSRLVIFDVLHVGGRSTRSLPYRARRSLLDELDLDGGRWISPARTPAPPRRCARAWRRR
jgi:bifunctional non-homologous end joining protein LigD